MKKSLLVVSLLSVFILATSAPSFASGFGFSTGVGAGAYEWEFQDSGATEDYESAAIHFGMVFDSNLSTERVFNYRLEFGVEAVDYNVKDSDDEPEIEMGGVYIINDLGFGILRKRNIRVWAGPEFRLSFLTGEDKDYSDFEYEMVGVGIGPVIGVNFNPSRAISITAKAGMLAAAYSGNVDYNNGTYKEDIESSGAEFYFVVGMLFRIGEGYYLPAPPPGM